MAKSRMSNQSSGIVEDGLHRLLQSRDYRQKQAAVEAEIRAKFAAELSAATDSKQRAAIKVKIRQEIKRSKPSPYSLW